MTHRIAEQDLKLGYYVIGVFDVLGQSRKLLRPMSFSPRTHVEERLVADKLRETVIAVDRFRDLFQRQFDERRKAFDQDASLVPEPQRTAFRAALASNIVSWGMSDAFCVAVPLEAGSGATGAMAAMADVRRLLEVAAATWLFSFAEGDPIRGGMEIGTAAKMRENDVYGAALVEAYHLESNVARAPRIVVGEQLVSALQDLRQDPDVNFQGAAVFATQCCSMLRQDADGKTALDVLGGSWATAER